MDYHKQEWEEKPVVMDKPRRGREMVTAEVPTDLMDAMRTMATKHQLKGGKGVKKALEAEREGNVELYHEGWVDGKKYLIPDSNLEIMKDLVNLRIRRKGDSIFVKDKKYEHSKLDTQNTLQRKLKAMTQKINELEEAKLVKKKSMYRSEPRSVQESVGSSAVLRRSPFEIVPMSEESTTFLVSGHIRENYSPLFIIQKYKGKSPFGRRRSDFSQVKSTRNVDILISGNFFRKSVLEEKHNAIEGIRVKWNLLVPVDERSKLYERRFSQRFNVKGVEVLFEGDFIKEKGLSNYTPILTFLVPQPAPARRREGRRPHRTKSRPAYKSISDAFERKTVSTYTVQVDSKPSIRSTRDEFTSREASGVEESSTEEVDGRWSSTEWLNRVGPTVEELPTNRDQRGGYGEVENDNGSYQIRLVMVSSRNGRRSVAGGSSFVRLPEDKPSIAVAVEQDPDTPGRKRNNVRGVDEEEAVVFYVTRDDLCDQVWSPLCSVEPSLKSNGSHSTWERGSQYSVCGRDRRERGDAGNDRRAVSECESDDHRPRSNNSRATRHENLRPPEDKVVQGTSGEKEETSIDCQIPEYKCQVRPSKRRSQGNCLLGSISRLFSK